MRNIEITREGKVIRNGEEWIPSKSNAGYHQISWNGKTTTVHRLVAELFIPNPEGYTHVDHINEDKTDNRVENLRWISHRDNIHRSGNTRRGKLTLDKAIAILNDPRPQDEIAPDYGITPNMVGHIKRGYSWKKAQQFKNANVFINCDVIINL